MTQEPIKIDKNIPIPTGERGKRTDAWFYPIESMEIGDSFEVPCANHGKAKDRARGSFYNRFKILGFKLTTRTTRAGFRVWRTE